ncbi:hypothetical protein GCM10027088_09570 [Nocardia goodfellowii]
MRRKGAKLKLKFRLNDTVTRRDPVLAREPRRSIKPCVKFRFSLQLEYSPPNTDHEERTRSDEVPVQPRLSQPFIDGRWSKRRTRRGECDPIPPIRLCELGGIQDPKGRQDPWGLPISGAGAQVRGQD